MAKNDPGGCAAAAVLLVLAANIAFWGGLLFVAVHFIGKFW